MQIVCKVTDFCNRRFLHYAHANMTEVTYQERMVRLLKVSRWLNTEETPLWKNRQNLRWGYIVTLLLLKKSGLIHSSSLRN